MRFPFIHELRMDKWLVREGLAYRSQSRGWGASGYRSGATAYAIGQW